MKRISMSVIRVGFLLALFSCGEIEAEKAKSDAKTLTAEVYKVMAQPFNNELTTTANLLAEEQVDLMAPIAGQVLNISFKEGQAVRKGQSLIRLDDRIWKAELVGVVAELASAEKDLNRKKQLLEAEGTSQEEVDLSLAKVQTLQSKKQQLQVNINLANVSAPFAGQLGMRDFSKGAFLKQGDFITSLTANKQLKVDFDIAQDYKNSVQLNKRITVVVDNDSLTATIYAISPAVNSETRMIAVRAVLDLDEDLNILPGTYAEVILPVNAINDALLVPSEAVVPSINEQTIYVYNNGKAERRVITLGSRTADKVHVLTGVNEGDVVLITGLLAVKDGMSISIKGSK